MALKKVIDRYKDQKPPEEVIDYESRLWSPQSQPQWDVINSEAIETLAGGAAGGGKSALLLILATRYGRNTVIFRRTYPNLKELIEKSKEILSGIARYNSTSKLWRDIPGGRTLEFGAIERDEVKSDWRGRAHDMKLYDEVTEFSESTYQFLNGWNRTTIPGQRCRIVATCNPPSANSKGYWVKERWSPWLSSSYPGKRAEPGELRWFVRINATESEAETLSKLPSGSLILRRIPDDRQFEVEVPDNTPIKYNDEEITPTSRTFIPALLTDNPFLKNTPYRTMLQSLPEPLRSQLLKGDWEAGDLDDSFQLIPSEWVRAAQRRWVPRLNVKPQVLGVDISRGGNDETTIAPRWENHVAEIKSYPGTAIKDGAIIRDLVLLEMSSRNATVVLDLVGVGSSPYDLLKMAGARIFGFSGGKRAVDPESGDPLVDASGLLTFDNLRSWAWWQMREWLNPANYPNHGVMPELPPDERLFADLTSPRWTTKSVADPDNRLKAVIVVESKDDIKKRLQRSPDRGDAVVMSLVEWSDDSNAADWLLNI